MARYHHLSPRVHFAGDVTAMTPRAPARLDAWHSTRRVLASRASALSVGMTYIRRWNAWDRRLQHHLASLCSAPSRRVGGCPVFALFRFVSAPTGGALAGWLREHGLKMCRQLSTVTDSPGLSLGYPVPHVGVSLLFFLAQLSIQLTNQSALVAPRIDEHGKTPLV